MRSVFTFDAAGALLAVAFFLPFERIGSITLGGITVRPSQIALLAALAFAVRGWLRQERVVKPPRLFGWLMAFFAVAALSTVHSENPPRSLTVLAFTIFTASLALLITRFLSDERRLKQARAIILFSAGVVGLFGVWQFLGDMAGAPTWMTGLRSTYSKAVLGFTRIQSTALEPLYFANYLLLPLGLAMAWLMSGARKTGWLWLLVGLLTLNLFLTSSRGGYGGFIVLLAVLGWSYRSSTLARGMIGRFLAISVVIITLSLAALATYAVTIRGSLSDTFITHVTTLTDGAAWAERLETSSGAIEAFRLHPWIGVGYGGYGPFTATFPFRMPDTGWSIVNNQYLEVLAETGAIGLAMFLMFLLSLIHAAARPAGRTEREAIRIGALAALMGMLVQYLTFSTLYVMHIWFTIGLVLASISHKDNH